MTNSCERRGDSTSAVHTSNNIESIYTDHTQRLNTELGVSQPLSPYLGSQGEHYKSPKGFRAFKQQQQQHPFKGPLSRTILG